jgi:natural product precursor
MKTLGKIKLNQFRKTELEQREMNALKGGCSCTCPCACVDAPGPYGSDAIGNDTHKSVSCY